MVFQLEVEMSSRKLFNGRAMLLPGMLLKVSTRMKDCNFVWIWILVLLPCPLLWASSTIYTWTDESGTQHFSDQPPPDDVIAHKVGETPAVDKISNYNRKTELLTARVVLIPAGDVMTVLRGTDIIEIRLHGIDCPEEGQAFAREARQFVYDLCFARMVKIRPLDTDPEGRTVAIVYLEDRRELNYELLKAGMAWHSRKFSNDKMYEAAVRHARKSGMGLWGNPDPVPPWDFRKAAFRLPILRR